MKRGFAILMVFALALSMVQALSLSNLDVNQVSCSTFKLGESAFLGEEIPEEIPYSNELFNIYVGGEIFGYLKIEESKIVEFDCIENIDKTYSVYIQDYSTISDFVGEDEMISVFQDKLKTGEIEVKGASFGKKIKWAFTRFGLNFVKAFTSKN